MSYQSTTASGIFVRIGNLYRRIAEASAQGFGDGDTIKLIAEHNRLSEELEQEAMREHLGSREAV
jgi:hypothetical protein